MNHHDAEVTDVTVVLEELDDAQTQDVVRVLMSHGMTVCNVDNDKSVVEGSIESCKVKELNKVERVRYVRSGMSYTVDYPVGDPRDKDGQVDVCDESED